MNLTKTISGLAHSTLFTLKKHSPEILTVAGVVGAVGATVLACKATLKANDMVNEYKKTIEDVQHVRENEEMAEKYSDEDIERAILAEKVQLGINLAKVYAPSVILGGLSIAAIIGSNRISKSRYNALSAAYFTLDQSYKNYRKRLKEKYGDEVDQELKYGITKAKESEEIIDENGKKKTVKKTVNHVAIDEASEYARFFDKNNYNFMPDKWSNMKYLSGAQLYFNDRLTSHKYVFLNEVYDYLGFARTKAGQVVGWRYDPDNKEIDSAIDFGLNMASGDFMKGHENGVLLDFNVDGEILNYMRYKI